MKFDVCDPRSIRRLNRRFHDPIAAWFGSALASLARWARSGALPGLPERQDLYGFSGADLADAREPGLGAADPGDAHE